MLSNGNYVVQLYNWNGGIGAATFGSGTTGVAGIVSSANSLVGSTPGDSIGWNVKALTNGNYVTSSWSWGGNKGAATFGNGTSGVSGVVNASNSLVGSQAGDRVGIRTTALINGSYLVESPFWNGNMGAVTWGTSTSGVAGLISSSNSLVGSTAGDYVGIVPSVALSNGNYVAVSPAWNGNRGAVTWGNGASGVAGIVASGNSLVGSTVNDTVGNVLIGATGQYVASGLQVFQNGDYAVMSPNWTNGAATQAGAITFASGTAGIAGLVSASNSLVGSHSNDFLGYNQLAMPVIIAAHAGGFAINNPNWNSNTGALTLTTSGSGISGVVSASNSLLGPSTSSYLGGGGVSPLANGSFAVASPLASSSAGLVQVVKFSTVDPATGQTFDANAAGNVTLTPDSLTAILNTGTAVDLQANNDITLAAGSNIVTSAGGTGGTLALQAGRSILLNSNITTDNGNFSASAGDIGAAPLHTDSGTPTLTLGGGTTLNVGSGTATLTATNGNINLNGNITAAAAGSAVVAASGYLNVSGAVNVGTFTLGGGTWNQVAATLPGFSANDFRIAGGTFIRALGGDGTTATPYQLADIYGVQGMGSAGMLGNSYVLANDIDAIGTISWNAGAGFIPVGNGGTAFTGALDGFDHSISNLAVNRPGEAYIGLFGNVDIAGIVDHLHLVNATIDGSQYVGALAGSNAGTVSDSSATGVVSGTAYEVSGYIGGLIGYNSGSVTGSSASATVSSAVLYTGGLVGYNEFGSISNSYATGTVAGADYVGGLVGYNYSGIVDTANASGSVSGGNYVGGLVGYNSTEGGTSIANAYASGTVFGNSYVGGLVGYSDYGGIETSYATGNVNGWGNEVGGLVGYNGGSISYAYATGGVSTCGDGCRDDVGGLVGYNDGSLSNVYATGGVTGYNSVGGLVGYNTGSISNAYATGSVTGCVSGCGDNVGGLVGYDYYATVSNSYASGSVTGNNNVGGLVGYVEDDSDSTITNAYASGSVTGSNYLGGLVGINLWGTFTNVYAAGTVNGTGSDVGGLLGNSNGTVNNGYWNSSVNASLAGVGSGTTTGATGLSAAEMMQLGSFSSWNDAVPNTIVDTGGSSAVWRIYEGSTTPLLRSFLTPLTITANAASKNYDGLAYSGGNGVTYSPLASPVLSGTLTYTGTSQGAANAGSYAIMPSGLFSGQQGYDISIVDGVLTINPAAVSVVTTSINASLTGTVSKTYDGTTVATLTPGNFLLSGFVNNDSASVTQTIGTYASKNVGSGILVSASLSSSDFSPTGSTNLSNYTLPTSASGNIGVITLASLTVSGLAAQNKVYDATTAATLTGTAALSGLFGSDVVTLAGSANGSFVDKNVGVAKPVTVSGISITGTDAGNYTLTPPSGLTANITPASLTLVGLTAQNKVYDATTVASITGTPTFSGLLGSDVVALGGTPGGSFADKNVGTAKPVSVTGLTLAGTGASNYTLSSTTVSLAADITVRPLSTWVGGASGNWSVASNWDALPDLSNVQAVSIPAGVSVTYDAGAGSTNLASLTVGGLNLAGGSLNIANSLIVNSSFSQGVGALALGSGVNASITQASGNLNVPALTLANLNLSAPAGAISQSGTIVTSTLNTQSQTGTTLNDAGNKIASFGAANSGSGNVTLINTVPLTITGIGNTVGSIAIDNKGAVTTVGPVIASSGPVTIVGHSPLTIGAGGVSASGDIVLTAGNTSSFGDNLTLSGPIGSGGSVALTAGDDLMQGANVTTNGGAILATAQTGNIILTSLNAGSGSISLNAGMSIQPAAGFTGANLIGGKALIVAGANANLSTQVNQLDVTVGGHYSITNLLTGTVITDASVAASTVPTFNQVLSAVTSTTEQQSTQTTTPNLVPTLPSSSTGSQLSSNSTQTIGGTEGTFGGAPSSEEGKAKDDKDKDKQGQSSTAKQDSGKPVVKKLPTCS